MNFAFLLEEETLMHIYSIVNLDYSRSQYITCNSEFQKVLNIFFS